MQFNVLGNSGLNVSSISLGCWALAGGSTWGPQDKEDAIKTIKTAFDLGINFYDTAEGYGNGYSEEILGKAVSGFRDKVVIASKVSASHLEPAKLQQSCDNSLQRLNTDYIDVYYIHWPSRRVPFSETMEALLELKQAGKIRAIACSNFGKHDLKELLKYGDVVANQLPYNLLFRAIEYDIKQLCLENKISITCYSSIAQGLLAGKFNSADEVPVGRARTRHFSSKRPQASHGEEGAEEETFAAIEKIKKIAEKVNADIVQVAISWLLSRKGVGSVIVGARNPEQIKQNVKAAELELSDEIIEELTNITAPLKRKLGENPDMWRSDSRYN